MPISTSRPSSSVPIGCAAEGGSITALPIWLGSAEESSGTAMPARARASTKAALAMPAGRVAKRRWKLAMAAVAGPHPRIDDAIKHVGHEVREDHGERGQEEDALKDRIVAVRDRGDEKVAEPRPGEDRLDQDRAGERIAEIIADHRDHRDEGVGQHVPP